VWSKLFLAIGPEKEYPKLVLKLWGLPNPFVGGLKLANFNIQTGLAQQSLQIFFKWQWVIMSNLCTPTRDPPKKWGWAKFFSPLRVGMWSKLFLAIGPENEYPKLVLKFGGSPK